MKTASALAALGVSVAAAAGASAQPAPPDPIGALLQERVAPGADPEEPDTAAAGTLQVEPEPPAPAAFRAERPPRPALTVPVYVQETGKAPDGPPTPTDAAYDSRIRASMAAARGFQGPLEGGWSLSAGGREVYVLQLADRDGAVQGAWRDVRRPGALDASGFVDAVERRGADLVFRFGAGVVATVHPAGDARWAGRLDENGHSAAVSLRRVGP